MDRVTLGWIVFGVICGLWGLMLTGAAFYKRRCAHGRTPDKGVGSERSADSCKRV